MAKLLIYESVIEYVNGFSIIKQLDGIFLRYPLSIFIIIVSIIFFTEIATMIILFQLFSYQYELYLIILYASVMIILSAPILLLWVIREKQGIDKLLREINRLEDVTGYANCGLLLLDNQARITYANNIAEKWFGPFHQIGGKFCWEIYKKNEPEKDCASLEALRTGETVHRDISMHLENGEQKVFYIAASPVKDDSGKILQINEIVIDITEHKLKEDALRNEKTFIESALNALQDVFYVFDLNGRFLRWNNALSAVTGYSDNEISTKKITDFFLGGDIQKISNTIEMVVKNGNSKVEVEFVVKNGRHINYEFNGTLLKDYSGKILGICGVGRDITEIKKMTLEYKTILHTAMDGFYQVDIQGRILDVNDSYCSLLGYNREELLNMNLKDIDSIDSEEIIALRIKRIMKIGWERFETCHKCKNGRIVQIEANVNYAKIGSGKLFVFVRDITQSKQKNEELKEVELRYRILFEQSPDGILIIDPETELALMFNDKACEQLGYSREEFSSMRISDYDEKEAPEETKAHIEKILRNGRDDFETKHLTRTGEIRDVLVTVQTIKLSGRNVFNVIFHDVTENKTAEKIRLENIRLEAADKAKSEFLASMSHELRTPLNASIGFSELLALGMAGELSEKQKKYVDYILKSNQFLLSLINDILDISKIEAGKIELVPDKMSVPETIEETLFLIKEKAMKHNVFLKIEIDPELEFIEADKQRFKQVLFNLLSNAVKFSKDEGGTVTIRAKKEGDLAKISVSDTGIGIKEDNFGKLFNKFEQLESGISQKYGGTGLGLSITKQLVELHGGKIYVESKYGEGTIFTFTLPLKTRTEGGD